MKKVFLTLSLLIFIQLDAQDPLYKTYSWDLNPNYKNYEVNQAEDLIAFKEKTAGEFYFLEKNSLVGFSCLVQNTFFDLCCLFLGTDLIDGAAAKTDSHSNLKLYILCQVIG